MPAKRRPKLDFRVGEAMLAEIAYLEDYGRRGLIRANRMLSIDRNPQTEGQRDYWQHYLSACRYFIRHTQLRMGLRRIKTSLPAPEGRE